MDTRRPRTPASATYSFDGYGRDAARPDVHNRESRRPSRHSRDTATSDTRTRNATRSHSAGGHDHPAPAGRQRSVRPSKAKCSCNLEQEQGQATFGMEDFDCEGGEGSKHGHRQTQRWIVGVSAAGLIVSGVVLIIVIFPLLNMPPSSSTSSNGSQQSAITTNSLPSASERFTQSNTIVENQGNTDTSDSPDLQDFYSYVVKNVRGSMNPSVAPCDDFYEYACGNWKVLHPPPGGVSSWSNFEAMTVEIWDTMEEELEMFINTQSATQNLHSRASPGRIPTESALLKANDRIRNLVVNYYTACKNETQLALLGVGPIQEILHKMDKEYRRVSQELQPLQAFQRMLEYVHFDLAIHAFFGWKIEADNTIANSMAIELITPGVDLLQQGTVVRGNDELITLYKQYASNILEMVGTYNNLRVENEVNVILHLLQIYQPVSGSPLVNDTSVDELKTLAPFLDWHAYFNKGFNRMGAFINRDERILSLIQDYLSVISREIIKEISNNGSGRLYIYLRWQVIQYFSQFLHKPARNAILPLFDGVTGENVTALPNFRYKPCIKELEERFPLPIAYLLLEIVKKQLHKGKTVNSMIRQVEQMASNIRDEYINYIDSFKWLKPSAKNVLLEKLRNVNILVGYPPVLDDTSELHKIFENLNFNRFNLLENQLNLLKFNQNRKMKFLRDPGQYSEWEVLSPMSLISFYVYRRNTLLIPLGGFMYPLFSSNLPEPLAYATMGVFISHELGHAVDFVGRTRDMYGRANATMWDEPTVADFVQKVLCRVNEYSEMYYPVQGLLTIAEVMADDGSVSNSFKTIESQLHQTKFPAQISDLMTQLKLTPDQFFFLHYAQLFCTASAHGGTVKGVAHYPPHSVRVRATLTNTPDFHTAFGCQKNTKMNPIKGNCDIW